MSENTISNIKINGVLYSISDSSKASIEDIENVSEITQSNNDLLIIANSKLDELLKKTQSSNSTTTKQTLVLSGFSSSETAIYGVDLNGEYVLVSDNVPNYDRVWVCADNGVQLMYKSSWGYWGLLNNTASGNTYTYGEGENPYKSDGSSSQWETQGANITATAVVKSTSSGDTGGDSGDSGDTDTTAKQTLTATGFNTALSLSNADGDYVLDDETKTEYDRTWTHTNGIYRIQWQSGLGWTFGNTVAQDFGNLYTDLVANPYGTSWYYQGSGALSYVSVTVKSADSGEEEEGGDDTSTSYLLVSGFSSSNFGGAGTTEDPNGKYYLQDATATEASRVWVSESGYFKIYNNGYWYIDGVNTNLGDSVYIDNTVSDPYQEDGSSYTWWSMGAPISGASVTLVSNSDSGSSSGYSVTCADLTDISGNYYEADAPSWGDSAYTYYKHETKNYYMYIGDDSFKYVTFRAFDEYGFDSSILWLSAAGTDPLLVTTFMNENSGMPCEITITEISDSQGGGDSDGGEDTPGVTYLYTVSSSSNASANGDYYDTGETFNDVATYTNGSCYIFFDTGKGLWYLSEHKNNTTNAPLHTCSNSTATPTVPTSGWSDGITVTVYGGGGSSDGGNGALFRVSGAGSAEANGDYYDTGETRNNLPIYKNENNIYMYFSTQCGYSWANGWCLSPNVIDEGDGMLYCTVASDADTYPTNMLSSWSTLDGVSPTPVCRELDENGNEIIPADYTVSGAGTEDVNGDYYATGNYISGTNGAIYKHATNEVYLFGNGSNCFFAFEATSSPAYYYTCETYSYDIQTGDWANAIYPSTGSGSTPYPTVTKN